MPGCVGKEQALRVGDEVVAALNGLHRGLPLDLRAVAVAVALEDALLCTLPDGLLESGELETAEGIRTFLTTVTCA